jgi:hypothetical protein
VRLLFWEQRNGTPPESEEKPGEGGGIPHGLYVSLLPLFRHTGTSHSTKTSTPHPLAANCGTTVHHMQGVAYEGGRKSRAEALTANPRTGSRRSDPARAGALPCGRPSEHERHGRSLRADLPPLSWRGQRPIISSAAAHHF